MLDSLSKNKIIALPEDPLRERIKQAQGQSLIVVIQSIMGEEMVVDEPESRS